MARPKKNGVPVVIEEPLPDDEASEVALDLAAETLTGDIRDFILDRLKHEQSKRPWHERSEADQRDTVFAVEAAVREVARKAVEIIAGHGRRSIKATIEQIVIKDGYKAVLTMSKFDENRHALADAQGSSVLVVVADPDEFTGERAPAEVIPDQASLLSETVAVAHSVADDSHSDAPFH